MSRKESLPHRTNQISEISIAKTTRLRDKYTTTTRLQDATTRYKIQDTR